jgi:hypothetical protein
MNNYTGLEYLYIDIAGQFGHDKWDFEPRIEWTKKHEGQLESMITKADDPFRFAAAVIALRDTQKGVETGHLCGLDACASGMQVMSAVTGDPIGALNTGLTSQHRQDVYLTTTQKMNSLLGSTNAWSRDIVKPATMTFYYGSRAEPRNAFGEDTPELKAFYAAQKEIAPGAYHLMSTLLETWQPYAEKHSWTMPDGFTVHNTVTRLHDTKVEVDELDHTTFIYRHEVNAGTKSGLANAANIVHSIDGFVNRELCYRCNHDDLLYVAKYYIELELRYRKAHVRDFHSNAPRIERLWEEHKFLSLTGCEHVNSNTVMHFSTHYLCALLELIEDTIQHIQFDLATVHDEFKAHANNMDRVRQVYIEIFAELAESNILNTILEELTGEPSNIQPIDPNLGDKIRLGNYALA